MQQFLSYSRFFAQVRKAFRNRKSIFLDIELMRE